MHHDSHVVVSLGFRKRIRQTGGRRIGLHHFCGAAQLGEGVDEAGSLRCWSVSRPAMSAHHAPRSMRGTSALRRGDRRDGSLVISTEVRFGTEPPGSRRALKVGSQAGGCRSEPAAGRRPGPGATRQVSVRVPDRAQSGPGGEGRRLLPESVGHNRPFLILQSCPSRIEPGRENPATRAGSPRRWPGSDRRRVRCQRVRRRLNPKPARPRPRRARLVGSARAGPHRAQRRPPAADRRNRPGGDEPRVG